MMRGSVGSVAGGRGEVAFVASRRGGGQRGEIDDVPCLPFGVVAANGCVFLLNFRIQEQG